METGYYVKCVGLTPIAIYPGVDSAGGSISPCFAISSPGSGWEAVVKVVKRSQTVLKQS